MTLKEFSTIAMITAIPIILSTIIWAVTRPITFDDRINVIILACEMSVAILVILCILAVVTVISRINDMEEN